MRHSAAVKLQARIRYGLPGSSPIWSPGPNRLTTNLVTWTKYTHPQYGHLTNQTYNHRQIMPATSSTRVSNSRYLSAAAPYFQRGERYLRGPTGRTFIAMRRYALLRRNPFERVKGLKAMLSRGDEVGPDCLLIVHLYALTASSTLAFERLVHLLVHLYALTASCFSPLWPGHLLPDSLLIVHHRSQALRRGLCRAQRQRRHGAPSV
jgi:hypothetical protein